jgi:hypothetical protein
MAIPQLNGPIRDARPIDAGRRMTQHQWRPGQWRPGQWWLGLVLLSGLVLFSGCIGTAAQLLYVIYGNKTKAEFDGFKGKRVAVVTVADTAAYGPDTLSETLSRAVTMHLVKNVKKIDVVPQGQIANWMDTNGWGQPDPQALGESVKADFVLIMEVSDYTIHDGRTLYKGQSNFKVDVYNVKENGRLVFSRGPNEFIFPRDGRPAIESSERKFEAFYLARLSDRIAKMFYEYDSTQDAAIDSQMMN